jgi:hypothetical protein
MTDHVVIIVPSQGDNVGNFLQSARAVRDKVYHGKGIIVKTKVTPEHGGFKVKFLTLGGHAFSFEHAKHQHVTRVLTISHAFSGDGPNLAYHHGGYQPWPQNDPDKTALTPAGEAFWKGIGRATSKDAIIILMGCFMGAGNYAKNVAAASDRSVYASEFLFGAGNPETAVKYAKAIEHGEVPAPMKKFGRPIN